MTNCLNIGVSGFFVENVGIIGIIRDLGDLHLSWTAFEHEDPLGAKHRNSISDNSHSDN